MKEISSEFASTRAWQVIKSCKTLAQLEVAVKYCRRMEKFVCKKDKEFFSKWRVRRALNKHAILFDDVLDEICGEI